MTPLYVFDLDGTLTLSEHRTYMLADKSDPHRWRKFYAACIHDLPNWPIINLFSHLVMTGCNVQIVTGRSDEVRDGTIEWLEKFTPITMDFESILWMRKYGDHKPDTELKKEWYDSLSDQERKNLQMVFEDRTRVVEMWRGLGVACMQVAPGEF